MAKRSYLISFVVLLLLGILPGEDKVVDQIVARVNDSIITRTDLEKAKERAQDDLEEHYPSDWNSRWPERQKDVLRDLIDQQLLVDKGDELGITGETETITRLDKIRTQLNLKNSDDLLKEAQKRGVSFEEFREQIRRNVVAEQVIGMKVGSHIHPYEQEIRAWYKEHQQDLIVPNEMVLAEILVSSEPPARPADDSSSSVTSPSAPSSSNPAPDDPARIDAARTKAKDLLEQLHKGANFEELAKSSSDGPTASQGGLLGDYKQGEMDKSLEEKLSALKTGDISDIIQTHQGFVIFRVLDHRAPGVPPLDEVRDKISDVLYAEQLQTATRTYLTRLRQEGYIEIRDGYVDTGASPTSSKPVVASGKGKR